jgi:hypothetical protein
LSPTRHEQNSDKICCRIDSGFRSSVRVGAAHLQHLAISGDKGPSHIQRLHIFHNHDSEIGRYLSHFSKTNSVAAVNGQ